MNIQDAINSGKNFRRNGGIWLKVVGGEITAVEAMKMYKVTSTDIVATDWEVVPEPVKDSLEIEGITRSFGAFKIIDNDEGLVVAFFIETQSDGFDFELTEKDVDKLLDFLYNNTKVGKDRILPF
jgi:hypothetical protein